MTTSVKSEPGKSTRSGQDQAGRVAKKHGEDHQLPAPPIVAKRARTAAKLWVFGWPRFFSTQLANEQSHVRISAKVAQDLSKLLPLQLQLELAARRFLLVLGYCN